LGSCVGGDPKVPVPMLGIDHVELNAEVRPIISGKAHCKAERCQ